MPSAVLSKYALVEPAGRDEVIAYCNWCKTRGRKHSIPLSSSRSSPSSRNTWLDLKLQKS